MIGALISWSVRDLFKMTQFIIPEALAYSSGCHHAERVINGDKKGREIEGQGDGQVS